MNYYFAYGSNLSKEQMKARCPDSQFLGAAVLKNHQLDFTTYQERWQGGCADVIEAPGREVWGALYLLSDRDLELLDGFEGHPEVYVRSQIEVLNPYRKPVVAHIYTVVKKLPFQKPSPSYIQILREAGKALGFSPEYQEYLGRI
jgi:gamma-glutamylcyclotransferase (GGCT)/AIG2-like uncharacterized protein YtfP